MHICVHTCIAFLFNYNYHFLPGIKPMPVNIMVGLHLSLAYIIITIYEIRQRSQSALRIWEPNYRFRQTPFPALCFHILLTTIGETLIATWFTEPREYESYGDFLSLQRTPQFTRFSICLCSRTTCQVITWSYITKTLPSETAAVILRCVAGSEVSDNAKLLGVPHAVICFLVLVLGSQ